MLYPVWHDAESRRSSLAPNLVLVNASDATELGDIEVRTERTVQPHHFWVGRSEARAPEEGASSNG